MIYFIQGVDGGPIKIGYTKDDDPANRLKALQTGSPNKLRLLHLTAGSHADERAIHARFAHLRLHGEWFKVHPDLQEVIPGPILYEAEISHRPVVKRDPEHGPLSMAHQAVADRLRSRQEGWHSPRQIAASTGLPIARVVGHLRGLDSRGWLRSRRITMSKPRIAAWTEYRLLDPRPFGSSQNQNQGFSVAGSVADLQSSQPGRELLNIPAHSTHLVLSGVQERLDQFYPRQTPSVSGGSESEVVPGLEHFGSRVESFGSRRPS